MNSQPITLDLLSRSDLDFVFRQLDRYCPENLTEIVLALLANQKTRFLGNLLKKNKNVFPLRSLLRIVVKRHAATCCLREHPYLDMGYWDTYSSFYSRCFKLFEKTCERLHFFRGPEDRIDELRNALLAGETEEVVERLGFAYLGFVVLRPTQSHCVGRTALLFDERRGKSLPSPPPSSDPEYEGRPRGKGASLQTANLLGAKLRVSAVPYLQQDVVTGMCATASVWTASQVLAERHDLHRFAYLEITRQAVAAASDDEAVARGLYPSEIMRALQATGARVERYFPTAPMSGPDDRINVGLMRDILYSYVESHIPVIVLLPRHAVCCIGHLQPHIADFKTIEHGPGNAPVYPRMLKDHYLVSETIPRFYVHNDAYGPYDRLDFLGAREHAALNKDRPENHRLRCPVVLARNHEQPLDLQGLIVPVPPYVRSFPHLVTYSANQTFAVLFRSLSFVQRGYKVLWRTVLTKGSTFKRSLEQRGYSTALRKAYATLHLSKYIWLCEISIFHTDETEEILGATDERKAHGEFIYDASTPSFNVNAISCRFGPYLIAPPEEEPQTEAERATLLEQSFLRGVGYDSVRCFKE